MTRQGQAGTARVIFLWMAMLFLWPPVAGEAQDQLVLKKNGKDWIILKGQEEVAGPADTMKVSRKGKDYFFTGTSGTAFRMEPDKEGCTIYGPDRTVVFKVRAKPEQPEKVEILRGGQDTQGWSVKLKESAYWPDISWKVKRGDTYIGRIKFHANKGKIKVKNEARIGMCTMKATRPGIGAVVCLMEGVKEEELTVLFASLALLGK